MIDSTQDGVGYPRTMACLRGITCALFLCACNPLNEIPPRPDAAASPVGTTETFAFDAILLGDSARLGGTPIGNEWEQFGYDLDGKWTKRDSTDVCDSPQRVDGDGGVDNAFGQLWSIQGDSGAAYEPDFPTSSVVAAIRDGQFTVQLQFDALPSDSRDATQIGMRVFLGGAFGAAPTFDSTTDWPVLASSLADVATLQSGAAVHFDDGYTTDGTFVSAASKQVLRIPITTSFVLPIHHPVITFRRDGSSLRDGIIAGILDPAEMNAACSSFFDWTLIADMLSDGTNRPGVSCNAVSIGLGFSARQIANPTQVAPDPAPTGFCVLP